LALSAEGKSLGSIYRGGTGQWSWALHRITGVGLILFLFVHIADTALIAISPQLYDRVIESYHNPIIKGFEIGLAGLVLFHALNGLRIVLVDFVPRLADHQKRLFGAVVGLWIALFVPCLYFMGKSLIAEL
jgi:succinate dehydrogenase / fumarate reductase, cytochrome b subunit